MKKILISILTIFMSVCFNATSQEPQNVDFLRKNSSELTDLHKKAFDLIREQTINTRDIMDEQDIFFDIFINEDDYTIKAMSFYELDTDKFMEDPRDERIPECLRISENELLFLVETKTGELYHLEARKLEDEEIWMPGMWTEDLRSKLSWLGAKLKTADSGDYTLFMFLMRPFYILKFDGKPVFYNVFGEVWGEGEVSKFIVTIIENKRNAKTVWDLLI